MANVVGQNPLILDSTGTAVTTANMAVRLLVWSGATTNATLSLKDVTNGSIMFAVDALYANMPPVWEWPLERPLAFAGGLSVATISSGRLFVYSM